MAFERAQPNGGPSGSQPTSAPSSSWPAPWRPGHRGRSGNSDCCRLTVLRLALTTHTQLHRVRSGRSPVTGGNRVTTQHPGPAAKQFGAERPKLACPRHPGQRTATSHKRRGVLVMKGSAVRICASASETSCFSGASLFAPFGQEGPGTRVHPGRPIRTRPNFQGDRRASSPLRALIKRATDASGPWTGIPQCATLAVKQTLQGGAVAPLRRSLSVSTISGAGVASGLALLALTGASAAPAVAPAALSSAPNNGPAARLRSAHPRTITATPGWASTNWSGYAITTTSKFTAVTGAWVVPSVARTSSSTYSAAWIGIDGFANSSLIQTGTEQDYYNGAAHYAVWWTTSAQGFAEQPISQPVRPGDKIPPAITSGTQAATGRSP